jgi:hypothetical protein
MLREIARYSETDLMAAGEAHSRCASPRGRDGDSSKPGRGNHGVWLSGDSFLYDVNPMDPITFAAIGTILLLIARAVCWIPARGAMNVLPMAALSRE